MKPSHQGFRVVAFRCNADGGRCGKLSPACVVNTPEGLRVVGPVFARPEVIPTKQMVEEIKEVTGLKTRARQASAGRPRPLPFGRRRTGSGSRLARQLSEPTTRRRLDNTR